MARFVSQNKLSVIENHFHNSDQVYGLTTNAMARKAVTPIVITGGSGAWGTELLLTDGTLIESGATNKVFDLSKLGGITVGTSARPTVLEFYYWSLGTVLTSVVITDVGDLFTKVGSGLSNGDKVILSSIVTSTGINTYTVYYVVGVAGNDFQVSLTVGGAAVVIGGGNGTCSVQKISQTLLTETVVNKASTDTDSNYTEVKSPRIPCNSYLSCRGWSATGTNAISFWIILHTYTN